MNLDIKIHEPPQRKVKFCLIKDGEFFLLPANGGGSVLCQRLRLADGAREVAVLEVKSGILTVDRLAPTCEVIPLTGVTIEAWIDTAKRDSKQMVLG